MVRNFIYCLLLSIIIFLVTKNADKIGTYFDLEDNLLPVAFIAAMICGVAIHCNFCGGSGTAPGSSIYQTLIPNDGKNISIRGSHEYKKITVNCI